MSTLFLTLPIPPVVNKLWAPVATRKGAKMVKRAASEDWAAEAKQTVAIQREGATIPGRFAALIVVPETPADIDARIKPILDACQHGGAIANDKHCRSLRVEIDEGLNTGLVQVELTPLSPVAARARTDQGNRAHGT